MKMAALPSLPCEVLGACHETDFPGFGAQETVSGDATVLRRGDWDTWTDPDIQINDLVCPPG